MVIQAIRDNIPKWVTGVILALLVIPFALWGINSYFTASSDNSVATVNGDPIKVGDYQQAYQSQYQRIEQMYGQAFRPELVDEKALHEQTLQTLINQTLVDQQIAKDHYTTSDAQLRDAISKNPSFQSDGKFNAAAYKATLTSIGMTTDDFERRMRENIVTGQFQGAITDSAIATPAELAAATAVRDQQRDLAYLLVSSKRFQATAQAGDAEIEAYYKAHQADFMTPEKVTLEYVELDAAQLQNQSQPSDADLQALYQQQLDKYKQAETRDARHILIAVNAKRTDAEAKAEAEDVLKQIKAGGDFAKLAEKYSDDPGSAKQGGEIKDISHGMMVKPFEDALFGIAKPGDVVGPVKTQYGYHIIQLEGVKAGQVKTFAEVKPSLVADWQKKQGDDKYYAMGDQLANLAYEQPHSLDEVSKQLKLPIQVVTDVTKDGGPGIGANADVRKAAFSDDVLTQGNNSAPILLGTNHAVVIRVKGHESAAPMALATVKDKIAALVKQQKAADATNKLAATLLDELKKGQDAAAVAKSAGTGVSLVKPGFVTRDQQGVTPEILSAAFSAPEPAAGARSYATAALPGGDVGVLVVDAVKPGDSSGMKDSDKLNAMRSLSQADGYADFSAYLAYLRAQGKVTVNTKNLEQSDQ